MIINMNGAKAPETPSSVLQEKTVTPETLPTVIGPDDGYDGLSQVTVNPDPQLKAENIRSGKTIFGVEGTFTGGGNVTPKHEMALRVLTGDYSADNPLVLSPETVGLLPYSGSTYNVDIQCVKQGSNSSDYSSPFQDSVVTIDFRNNKMNWGDTNDGANPYKAMFRNVTLVGENHLGDMSWATYPDLMGYMFYNTISIYHKGSLTVDKGAGGYLAMRDFTFYNMSGYDTTYPENKAFTLDLSQTKIHVRSYCMQLHYMIVKIKDFEGSGNYCISLDNCTLIMGTSIPPTLSSDNMLNASGTYMKIIVPKGSLDAYKTAQYWEQYANYMEEAA